MNRLSTHVLDLSRGTPAADVSVALAVWTGTEWRELAAMRTNADGRVSNLLDAPASSGGQYRLRFATREYFARHGVTTLYPYVDVVFEAQGDADHHVPLLLSPFGYSTYRGS